MMSTKAILIIISLYFTIIKTQEISRGDQSVPSLSPYDYDYYHDFDYGPERGDLIENEPMKIEKNERKKRSSGIIRGDQGPPPDYDYYSNYIDEEPTRGDLGDQVFDFQGHFGSSTVDISRFPYQASLTYYNNFTDQWEHSCSGSIISESIIITAANCVDDFLSDIYSILQIRVGSSSSISGGTLYKVKKIIIHEAYNKRNDDNDIALIVVYGKINFSEKINRIPIVSKCTVPGTMALLSGWGYLKENLHIPSPNLNYINVPLIDNENCQKVYEYVKNVTNSMICAGFLQGGKGFCTTDSGSPLAENGELIGVVSWGSECGEGSTPIIYTDIFYMREWIINKLKLYSMVKV